MLKFALTIFVSAAVVSCSTAINDTFNSEELVSSKGEKIYVNTLNWGITGDYQISAISANKDKIRDPLDTLGTVKGLEPFFYSFKNDTLSLYFNHTIRYRLQDNFKTIHVNYIVLDSEMYQEARTKAYNNQENYYSVPTRGNINYPADMPKPPK